MDTVQASAAGENAGADPITVTIRRACELSGLSRTTINRLIWAKKLRSTHVEARHLVYFDSLQQVLGLNQSEAA
jgi:hypothetical protein